MIGISFSLPEWLTSFDIETKNIENVSEFAFEASANIVLENTIARTPVGDTSLWNYPAAPGYTPGKLKASWTLIFQARDALITNSQPYAERVEYGWSTQAPEGMLRRSIAEFPSILEQTCVQYKL